MELRHTLRASLAAAIAALALATPAPSRADERSEAEARFYEGTALYSKGKYDEARLKFAQAYAVLKKPAVVYNLAKTEALTLRAVDATNHFREYLKTAAPSKERADAERELQDQTKLVTLVEVQAPEGAGLFLDGEQVGLSPLADSLVVAPGPHTVTARVGDAKQEKAFTGSRGETLKLSFVFEKASPAPAPSASSAPPPSATAPVPTYPPPVEERRSIVVPAIVGAAGVIALGVGAGFALKARGDRDDADAIRTRAVAPCADRGSALCSEYSGKLDDASAARTIAITGYVVGGASLAAAVALYFVLPAKRVTAYAAPSLSTRGSGLVFGATF